MEQPEEQEQLFLELGSFIKILAPTNNDLNEQTFYIQYLDENEVDILNTETLSKTTLSITNGDLNDKSIEGFEILSRPEVEGYARQNDLTPGKWITIQLGGEVPTIINGQITNLEEDMIELSTWPDNEKLYIDFEYKGIPKNIPISSIIPFSPPSVSEPEESVPIEMDQTEMGIDDDTPIADIVDIEVPSVKAQRKEILLDADEIEFGEKLERITQFVPVREEERRFGIETQTNDMLNDLLSTIPTASRSKKVLDGIHTMIERFQQLRTNFSKLSDDGEMEMPDKKTADYKPLIEKLSTLSQKLMWLLPIAREKKVIYDSVIDEDDMSEDIDATTLALTQTEMYNIIQQYKTNNVPDGENKYKFLFRNLNKHLTPFIDPINKNNVIFNGEVNTSLDVIISNLEELYASVVCEEKFTKSKFVFERYNKGLVMPETLDVDKKTKKRIMANLTPNDNLSLLGFLQMPNAFVNYSQMSLPMTTISKKAQLNEIPLSYSTFLNKRKPTKINTNLISENDEPSKDIIKNFLKRYETFLFEQTEDIDNSGTTQYKKFLEHIIPRTRTLFNSIKNYIPNGTSYLKILYYLQPFLVYRDDITFKQYEEIVNFMRQKILDFKKDLMTNMTSYEKYINHKYSSNTGEKLSYLFSVLSKSQKDVERLYNFVETVNVDSDEEKTTEEKRKMVSTAEFMKHILEIDNGNLFMNSIAFEDIELFVSTDIDGVINKKLEELKTKDVTPTECRNFVLAKRYIDIDELLEDNGRSTVYFDEKYDETRYDIVNEFTIEKNTMSPSNFNDFLIEHLIKNVGLDEVNAAREARSMIEGKRLVSAGEYAITSNQYGNNIYYYRDNNNTWIHDKDLDGEELNGSIFCNIKKQCMDINNSCDTQSNNKKKVQEQLIKEMMEQFDDTLQLDLNQMSSVLRENKKYYASILNELLEIRNAQRREYDEIKYQISLGVSERTVIHSPFEELRDRILSQNDFVKKQSDILKFISKNCRNANLFEDEEPYWFYCIKTNVKLLPTFYETLANSYFSGNYLSTLEKISAERGQKSDDGDKIVDKYSGYLIRIIDFDEAEGYDEAGYKIVSRALMEEDVEDLIMDASFKPTDDSLQSKDGDMIKNIVKTLEQQLSISIGSDIEFIIKEVETTLDDFLPSKEAYEAQLKKTKKRGKSYNNLHDEALLMLTLAYFLPTTQTAIPSIKTDKTFKGCGPKSFQGYPLEGPGDYSALKYLACSALKLRSNTRPWNTLPKLGRETAIATLKSFMMKLKTVVDKQVMKNTGVKERIVNKIEYLRKDIDDEDEMYEFDARQWLTFLPPLIRTNIQDLQQLGDVYKENLMKAIKSGDPKQFNLLNVLLGKITVFSIKIQEQIQKVIDRESLLLSNSQNEFMIENSCCNEGSKITSVYLQEKDNSIKALNDRIKKYNDLYKSIEKITTPQYLFDRSDTKVKYPPMPESFSESTIYRAFMKFCQFNSGLMLNDEMSAICGKNSSEYKSSDDIQEKIETLKREGKNYDKKSFLKLMDIVNRENTIKMDLNKDIFSPRRFFESYLKNEKIVDLTEGSDLESYMKLMTEMLDRYDVLAKDKDETILNLTTFLESKTTEMMSELVEFTELQDVDNGKLIEFLNTVDSWKLRGENIYMSMEDETAETIYRYMNTYIENILNIYPVIIKNSVDTKNPAIPEHWSKGAQKLSETHVKDIKNIISSENKDLNEFYGNERVLKVIETVSTSNQSSVIIMLSKLMPFFSNIRLKPNQPRSKTILNGDIIKKVMKYLLVKSLHYYLEITNTANITDDIDIVGGNPGEKLEEDVLRGREMEIRYDISNLLIAYLRIMMKQKKVMNISNYDINQKVLKSKEKEKAKITKNLGELSVEARKVQDLMKNHRIGEWSLGQTKALYVYDENQYEKERMELQEDALRELELGGIDGVSERTSQIISFDLDAEKRVQSRVDAELNAAIMANGDDDNFDDDRDDEALGYMDAIRSDD